jgi:hypothetical protein
MARGASGVASSVFTGVASGNAAADFTIGATGIAITKDGTTAAGEASAMEGTEFARPLAPVDAASSAIGEGERAVRGAVVRAASRTRCAAPGGATAMSGAEDTGRIAAAATSPRESTCGAAARRRGRMGPVRGRLARLRQRLSCVASELGDLSVVLSQ